MAATSLANAQLLKPRGEYLFQVGSHLPGSALKEGESYSGQGGLVCCNQDLHEKETSLKQTTPRCRHMLINKQTKWLGDLL